jgi:hypothetical protein
VEGSGCGLIQDIILAYGETEVNHEEPLSG